MRTSLYRQRRIYTKKADERLVFRKVLDGVECGLFSGEVECQGLDVKFRRRVRAVRGRGQGCEASLAEHGPVQRAWRGHKEMWWYSQAVR